MRRSRCYKVRGRNATVNVTFYAESCVRQATINILLRVDFVPVRIVIWSSLDGAEWNNVFIISDDTGAAMPRNLFTRFYKNVQLFQFLGITIRILRLKKKNLHIYTTSVYIAIIVILIAQPYPPYRGRAASVFNQKCSCRMQRRMKSANRLLHARGWRLCNPSFFLNCKRWCSSFSCLISILCWTILSLFRALSRLRRRQSPCP